MLNKKGYKNIKSIVEDNKLYIVRKNIETKHVLKDKVPFLFLGETSSYTFFINDMKLIVISENLNESNRLIFGNKNQMIGKIIDNLLLMRKDKELSIYLNSYASISLIQAPSIILFSNTLVFNNIYGCNINGYKVFTDNLIEDIVSLIENYNENQWILRREKINMLNEIKSK